MFTVTGGQIEKEKAQQICTYDKIHMDRSNKQEEKERGIKGAESVLKHSLAWGGYG